MKKWCGCLAMMIIFAAGCGIISSPATSYVDSAPQTDCQYQNKHRPVPVDFFHCSICTWGYWYRLWILVNFAA
jgi:hypothetical protein